jgi:hypothetical protein
MQNKLANAAKEKAEAHEAPAQTSSEDEGEEKVDLMIET